MPKPYINGGGKMTEKNPNEQIMVKVVGLSFIIGIVITLLIGIYQGWSIEQGTNFIEKETLGGWIAWLLAVIGIVVGLLAVAGRGTITKEETPGYLMAGIALVVMYGVFKGVEINPWLGSMLHGISEALAIFVAPTIIILAIKNIYDMGKDV